MSYSVCFYFFVSFPDDDAIVDGSFILSSIDFNTINIHHTVGKYFFGFHLQQGPRDDIRWYDQHRSYYPIHSLLPRECIGKYFPEEGILDTLG